MSTPFFGLYQGFVTNNEDPEGHMRVKVTCPQVFGNHDTDVWAWSCLPPGSSSLPVIGSVVWLGFEGGDIDHPVWIGVLPQP